MLSNYADFSSVETATIRNFAISSGVSMINCLDVVELSATNDVANEVVAEADDAKDEVDDEADDDDETKELFFLIETMVLTIWSIEM